VTPAVLGLVIGIGIAWALESVVRASVFGWESSGPAAVAIVASAMLGVAVLAAVGPARRAVGIDPVRTLRAD
jgi:ABC-type antimicrobial peptide transport system permease subunit